MNQNQKSDGGSSFRTASATRLVTGLQNRAREQIGSAAFGVDGRLVDWRHSLLPVFATSEYESLLSLVDASRRRQPENGAAIALNSFLQWQRQPEGLNLAGLHGFDKLTFDARCPTGVRGTPPHMDMIAAKGSSIVAVTARGADYVLRKSSVLAAAYDSVEVSPNMRLWFDLLPALRQNHDGYRYVDVAGMLKFALGLARTFPNHDLTLLYLYWEPVDAAEHEIFTQHRSELSRLSRQVEGSAVRFVSQSFDGLWSSWIEQGDEPWLRELVAQLRGRYDLAIRSLHVL
ncbi:MAG: hypothetical protein KDG54_13085 [Geminicoccaceae bacterium]|nr:hypothetical protein [Geminicoccaceae bacterium]